LALTHERKVSASQYLAKGVLEEEKNVAKLFYFFFKVVYLLI
jgi:hypothetical protein